MVYKRRTAAIFAGLSGCGVLSVPVLAQAATGDVTVLGVAMNDLLASPWAYLAVGALVGGGVVGLVMGIARHRSTKRFRRALAEATGRSTIIRIEAPGPAHVLEVGGAGTPAAVGLDLYAEEPAETSTTADLGRVHGLPEDDVAYHQTFPEVPMGRPTHVSRRLDAMLPTLDGSLADKTSAPASQDSDGAAAQHPQTEEASQQDAANEDGRRGGVRSAISEHFGTGIMQGLPVIERADGSTTDIGTSWWEREVGSTHAFAPLDSSAQLGMVPVDQAPDPMSTAQLRLEELARAERNARAAGLSSAGTFGVAGSGAGASGAVAGRGDRAERAATIASRISSFDLSLYPEEDDGQSTSGEDMFEQAMRALDAQLPDTSVTTSEDAANVTTPLSADLQTGYVVTPESLGSTAASTEDRDAAARAHVDYLVKDEMERGQSRHHSFLTVFDGTGDMSDMRKASGAKHLAPSKAQKEA